MKKILTVMCLMFMMLTIMPNNVSAEIKSKNDKLYGTAIDETGWSSANPKVTQIYYVSKTNAAGYVYMQIQPITNVDNITITYSSTYFEKVSEEKNDDGSVTVLMKTKDGQVLNGTQKELFTVIADFTGDTSNSESACQISFAPLPLACTQIGNTYFDKSGKIITAEEYNSICGNTTTDDKNNDVPSPKTGSVVPYVAIGGGLLAVACVYLYTKKSSKFYKL